MRVKKKTFPLLIRTGSIVVKIYRVNKPETANGVVYALAWIDPARGRLTRQFVDLEKAKDEARLLADKLANGQIDAGDFTAGDRAELLTIRRITSRSGVPPIAAIEEWFHARELAGGSIIPAVEAWKLSRKQIVESLMVGDAIDRFMIAKAKAGVDVACSYKKILPHLADAFPNAPISSVTAQSLSAWLEKIAHPVTRNTARKRMVSVWRWSRKQGYLPRNEQTEAEQTDTAQEAAPVVGIITPTIFTAILELIREKHRHYLAATTLAGFCGLRRTEIYGQLWEDIHLDRGILNVTKAKRGTPARRLVHLCPSALVWLSLVKQDAGRICTNQAMDRIRDIGKTAGHTLPKNCFRHSFISHRVAATGNIPETSMEAGNSVREIHRHYRELVEKTQGVAWFEILPAA